MKTNNQKVRNKKSIKVVASLIFLILTMLILEIGSRLYLSIKFRSVTFLDHSELIYEYYYNIEEIISNNPKKGDKNFDILLLGGSVLHPNNGEIAEELAFRLNNLGNGISYKIHNASLPAHTSRDSKHKMDILSNLHFDLVLFYHGINEVRANNCPKKVYEKDYSHFVWYDEINCVMNNRNNQLGSIPQMLNYAKVFAKKKIIPRHYIPFNIPRNEWPEYGNEIKTRESFLSHLNYILKTTRNMGSLLVVPTFAYHLEEGYTMEKFEKNRYRDSRARFPVEIWGTAENVTKGIAAHNEILQQFKDSSDVVFVDMNFRMPKNDEYFDDICHLSENGSKLYAQLIVDEIEKLPKQ